MIYYFSDLDMITEKNIDMYLAMLPELRRKKALNYRFLSGKVTCIIAYLLFLYGYRNEYGYKDTPDFDTKENGKPYLINHPDIHFNISHCSKAVVCAFSKNEIGIDIETSRKTTPALIKKVCSDEEIYEINNSSNPELSFCKIWTEKEAISKLSGEGISSDLKKINSNGTYTQSYFYEPDMYITIASNKMEAIEINHIKLSEFEF